MGIFTGMTELELVEAYIQELYRPLSTVYADEQILSEAFDNMLEEFKDINTEDETMINEMFNDWTDSQCKEGNLHEVQYNNYCYVGKYS